MFNVVLVLIGGLIWGSFLNVVIFRLPGGESLLWPGSHCAACFNPLKPRDLVPVFSYICLKGRCRYCGEIIAFRYPLVELVTSLSGGLIYIKSGWGWEMLAGWILTSILLVAALIDKDQGIIPDLITYPGLLVGLLLSLVTVGFSSALLGGLLFGGILLVAAIVSRGGMGGGDIKLAAVIGVFTGWQGAWLAFLITSLMGGSYALYLLMTGRANGKTSIKFGPFLALGGWLAWIYGPEILNWYWNILVSFS